jgi:hypothetical protein
LQKFERADFVASMPVPVASGYYHLKRCDTLHRSSTQEITMTYKITISAVIFSLLIAISTSVRTSVPGWFVTGSQPKAYSTGTSALSGQNGGPAAFLRGNEGTDGFGTLMQMFSAAKYEGQRVRLSASIRTENLKQSAGLWMRMDGANGKILGFDNMQDRPITGITDWKRYEVVLDAPVGTRNIAMGVLMVDGGVLWMENVKVEVVPNTVRVTGNSVSKENPLTRMALT